MDKRTLLERITDALKKQEWMSKYAGSQFVTMLANIGWQIIRAAKSESENAIPEVNLSTATKRASILAAAEDKGYVGDFIRASSGNVKIKNTANYLIKLQSGSLLLSNAQDPYMILKTVNIPPGVEMKGIPVAQQEKVILKQAITEVTEYLELVIPKDISAELSAIEVYVVIDEARELWRKNQNFRLSRGTSKDYHLAYKPTDQYSIRFGDGSIGMAPPAGSEVIIEVMVSKGVLTLVEDQTLTPTDTISKYASALQVKTETQITDGAGREDIESTRQNALYYTAFDEQIVWGGDYAYFIKTNIPGIVWINVWGEYEQEKITGFDVDNINRIFICAHKIGVTQEELHNEIMAIMEVSQKGLNIRPTPKDKRDLPFTITLEGKCEKNLIIDEVVEAIKAALEIPFGENSSDYSASINESYYENMKISKIWDRINSLKLLTDFTISPDIQVKAENLYDFVYLNVEGSTFNISIKGEVDA